MWPIVALLALGAAMLVGRRTEPATEPAPQPAPSEPPELPPLPTPPAQGPAKPAGSLGPIKINKTSIARNDSVRVEYSFTLDTRDARGTLINWPTRVRTWLVHAQDNRVTVGPTVDQSNTFPPGKHERMTTLTVTPSDVWDGEKYRVDVEIEAAKSDDKGNSIPGSWKPLDFKSTPERITVVALAQADPSPEPEPEPEPPASQPIAVKDPRPQPKEPTAAAKWKLGDRVHTVDGPGVVDAVKWDGFIEMYLYQMIGRANWYEEPRVTDQPPATHADWPLNNTGQPRVRAINPQGQLVLITESEAAQRVNTPGWSLHGIVMPEPSKADLQQLVNLTAELEALTGGTSGVNPAAVAAEIGLSLDALDQVAAEMVGGRGQRTTTNMAHAMAALRLGWDPAVESYVAWGGGERLWAAYLATGGANRPEQQRRIGSMTVTQIDAVARRLGDRGTEITRQRINIANKYERSVAWLLNLARERGITA